jgi:hypothetical protein
LKKAALDLGLLQPNVESKLGGKQMYRVMFAIVGFGTMAACGPAAALNLGEAAETEAARANARAGGPTNARDAELLERYGCLSGTDSAFCRRLEHRGWHHRNHRYDRRRED